MQRIYIPPAALEDIGQSLPPPSLQANLPAVLSPMPKQADTANSDAARADTEAYAALDEYISEVISTVHILCHTRVLTHRNARMHIAHHYY